MKFENVLLKTRIIEKYGSQANFAKVLGVSPITVNKKVNGRSQMTLDDVDEWARRLQIGVDDIGKFFLQRLLSEN